MGGGVHTGTGAGVLSVFTRWEGGSLGLELGCCLSSLDGGEHWDWSWGAVCLHSTGGVGSTGTGGGVLSVSTQWEGWGALGLELGCCQSPCNGRGEDHWDWNWGVVCLHSMGGVGSTGTGTGVLSVSTQWEGWGALGLELGCCLSPLNGRGGEHWERSWGVVSLHSMGGVGSSGSGDGVLSVFTQWEGWGVLGLQLGCCLPPLNGRGGEHWDWSWGAVCLHSMGGVRSTGTGGGVLSDFIHWEGWLSLRPELGCCLSPLNGTCGEHWDWSWGVVCLHSMGGVRSTGTGAGVLSVSTRWEGRGALGLELGTCGEHWDWRWGVV
ncbi:uncharacterized protein LOC132381960 [Hypanus sabinus]|uniref:uncharacterized protein LOC132381960 n=1 Tax=Hypanus sabinus TaxID=79690 RepID=UPI0028C4F507|nr:uncharacterized protein LOC132381960 [Hypanus sabinus]